MLKMNNHSADGAGKRINFITVLYQNQEVSLPMRVQLIVKTELYNPFFLSPTLQILIAYPHKYPTTEI